MHITKTIIVVASLLCTQVFASGSIHYFDLKNRSATEVIPILHPLLQENEAISGDGYQLFIKTTNSRAKEIESLLQTIDRAAKMFRISVTNDEYLASSQNSIDGSIRVKTGDADIRVGNDRHVDEGVTVNINARTVDDQSNKTQFINVQEGKPAFVSREQIRLVPIYTYEIDEYGVDVFDHGRTPYASEDGFYVEARSTDNQHANVNLKTVSGSNERRNKYDYEQQFAETSLRVPLGKWFEIGGIDHSYNRIDKGILYRTQEKEERYSKIFLKIELLN